MSNLEFKTTDQKRQVILYELNEVPWCVIDWYCSERPNSAIANLIRSGHTYTTVTYDEGELHPWTTWPTLHRGVTNRQHGLRFINQSRDKEAIEYPPVWQTLLNSGRTVGVFGSLQSYEKAIDPRYEFYIPDTFSPAPNTSPQQYEAFQRFNLRQTKQDGAAAGNLELDGGIAADILGMMRSGLRFKTLLGVVAHIVREQINPLYRSRRSIMQAPVAFDFFCDALHRSNPDFCTFFTNHVAGMMHRYWRYSFPEDFGISIESADDKFRARSILAAMDIADSQIQVLSDYTRSRKGRLLVASSMGQEAVVRDTYRGEWRIKNFERFLGGIGWTHRTDNLMAMQPDFNFAFDTEERAGEFLITVCRLTDEKGVSVWKRTQKSGATVNIGLSPSPTALEKGEVWFRAPGAKAACFKIDELGIEFISRDPGTGYHQPKGIFIISGEGVPADDSRQEINLTEVLPAILRMFGIQQSPS